MLTLFLTSFPANILTVFYNLIVILYFHLENSGKNHKMETTLEQYKE